MFEEALCLMLFVGFMYVVIKLLYSFRGKKTRFSDVFEDKSDNENEDSNDDEDDEESESDKNDDKAEILKEVSEDDEDGNIDIQSSSLEEKKNN